VRAEMKKILEEVCNGNFAKEFILEKPGRDALP
jgi:ketol-acid reductoisomerase